jgi:hypothetical protein
VLENLSLRGSSWPKTCIEAIRDLESALSKTADDPNPSIRNPTAEASSTQETYPSNSRHNQTSPYDRHPPVPDRPPPISPADQRSQGQSLAVTNFEQYDTRPESTPSFAASGDHDERTRIPNSHLLSSANAGISNNTNGISPLDPVNTGDHHGNTTTGGNYNSAGLIFGDSYISCVPAQPHSYNNTLSGSDSHEPGPAGFFPGQSLSQEGVPSFSSSGMAAPGVDWESLFTSDIWSVADGPWLMHENGL